jgi:hypothetical protein
VNEPIEVTLTNQLVRFGVTQIPQLASVAAGLFLGLIAQPLVSRKSRSIEEVVAQSELLEERVQGYGEALSDMRRTQQGSHGWAFALVAVIAWRFLRRKAVGPSEADLGGDPLHAIHGMPWRTPLLGAFAAGQGQSTTVRWAPLLSLAVPCVMPQTCPEGASEGPAWRDGKAADRSRGLPECRSTSA